MEFPSFLVFYTTPNCNFNPRCMYCSPKWPEIKSELSFENIEIIAKRLRANGVRYVVISGGEPLLYPKLNKILRLFFNENYKIYLMSNGSLISEDFLKESGDLLSRIVLSLDNPDPQLNSLTRSKMPNNSLKNLITIQQGQKEHNYELCINCVITPYSDIPQIIEGFEQIGIRQIHFNPITVDFSNTRFSKYRFNKIILTKILDQILARNSQGFYTPYENWIPMVIRVFNLSNTLDTKDLCGYILQMRQDGGIFQCINDFDHPLLFLPKDFNLINKLRFGAPKKCQLSSYCYCCLTDTSGKKAPKNMEELVTRIKEITI